MTCHPIFPKPIKKTIATPEDHVNLKPHVEGKQLFRIIGLGIVTAGLATEPALGTAHGQWHKRCLACDPSFLCFLTPEKPCYFLFPHSHSLKNKKRET